MDREELVLITVSFEEPTIRGQPVRWSMLRLDLLTTSNNNAVVVVVVEDVVVVVEGVAVVLGIGTKITYQDEGYYDARGDWRGN
jgi:hypothetical protein